MADSMLFIVAQAQPSPWLETLGRFHVVFVHFPIALLACAALGETWSLLRRERAPMAAVRFCLWLGAAAFACTRDGFPDLMATAIRQGGIANWAARHEIVNRGAAPH